MLPETQLERLLNGQELAVMDGKEVVVVFHGKVEAARCTTGFKTFEHRQASNVFGRNKYPSAPHQQFYSLRVGVASARFAAGWSFSPAKPQKLETFNHWTRVECTRIRSKTRITTVPRHTVRNSYRDKIGHGAPTRAHKTFIYNRAP